VVVDTGTVAPASAPSIASSFRVRVWTEIARSLTDTDTTSVGMRLKIGPCHTVLPFRSIDSIQYDESSSAVLSACHTYDLPAVITVPGLAVKPDPMISDSLIRVRDPPVSRYMLNPRLFTSSPVSHWNNNLPSRLCTAL